MLHLIVGLPGAGKTTLARELERTLPAMRLTPDDWIVTLFGADLVGEKLDAVRDPVEVVQWAVADRALRLGLEVVLDFGFWTRGEREAFRARAAALGAGSQIHPLVLPKEELWARLELRNAALPPQTFQIRRDQLDEWWGLFEPPGSDELAERAAVR
jgi:predicted kinase